MGCASRRLAVLVAMLLPATNSAAAPPANPAAPIAVAAGHPAQHHIRAQTNWSREGQSGTLTLETQGVQRLERECADDLCSGSWFDGRERRTFGINGTPFPDRNGDPGAERTFAAIVSTAFAEPEFLVAGGTVASLPDAGDGQLRYRVSAPQGSELVAVADARTHRLTGVTSPDGTRGRRLIATIAGATTVYGTRAYDRVAAADGALVPPAGPAVSVGEPAELAVSRDALPIVACSLNGHPANCLIDTGTTPSAVTLDFAERLGQEPHGRIEIGGLGTYLTGAIQAGPLVVASATFPALRLAVIPRARPNFDVVLGSDVLAGLRIVFAGGGHRARIEPATGDLDGTPVALEFAAGLPFVEVRLGGRDEREPLLVDTGDSNLVSIGYDEYREDSGLFAPRGSGTAAGLGAEPMDTVDGILDRLDIAGQSLSDVPISAVRGQHGGHLGYALAGRCTSLTLDLGARRIGVRLSAPDRKQPAAREP